MSLIVARKDENKLAIVSDTRLTNPNSQLERFKTNPIDGIIKTIIIYKDLSISFAGGKIYAEDALKEIKDEFDFSKIIEILKKYHLLSLSNQETQFLLCIGGDCPNIISFKDGKFEEGAVAWIGDYDAFKCFQKNMDENETKKPLEEQSDVFNETLPNKQPGLLISEMDLNVEVNPVTKLFSKMSSAMNKVIEDVNISTVGDFKVDVIYDESFYYKGYMRLYRSNVSTIGYGEHILGHGSANEGAYSVSFWDVSENFNNVALHVKQGNFGILYSRIEYGLLEPQIFKMDEVDFSDLLQDRFNFLTTFSSQDPIKKHFDDAVKYFKNKNFAKSEHSIDKAFNAAQGLEKAKVLFHKGIMLMQLTNKKPAIKAFQETIKIDSSYVDKILAVINNKK